ncbi:MAG: helix-turn-helix transcriptional regulator [Bacteroidetes bacterium]|nr:helix-turn-helix transcriptional regulator [Bacteroidota bacterium]
MAELLSLAGKSSYKAYEEGRALPDIHKLMRLATFFDVGVVDLVYQDLESFKTKNSIEKTRQFKIVKIPVAAAGYSKGFEDADYIKNSKLFLYHLNHTE